jgi:M6 family metalloprotease-like protein
MGIALAATVLGLVSTTPLAHAYPMHGEVMAFPQPNGLEVQVILSGDEFHLSARSPEGYALIKDPVTGWICYAKPTLDGDLISSGIHYLGGTSTPLDLATAGIIPFQRRSKAKMDALAEATRRSMEGAPENAANFEITLAMEMQPAPRIGTISGVVVLVDFPDRVGSIAMSEVENAFNADTYGDSRGSIRTWSETISSDQVSISHQVIGYMRAAYPTTHYKYGGEMDYSASVELYKEIYAYIEKAIDLSPFAVNGALQSLAVLYIGGTISNGWASALWPHGGCGGRYTTSEKVAINSCYMSSLGTTTPLRLQTHRHELGHSFFKWPDTYDYDGDSKSAGGFAMETDMPCAPFRMWAGWILPTVINDMDQVFALPPNGNSFLRYNNPTKTNEYFILEYMKKEGWNTRAPDQGLLIWHVDDKGNNNYQDMTATRHYRLSVEQADGLFQLEKNTASGGAGDCFKAGGKTTFDGTTTPNSKWWSGESSGLKVCEVGPVAETMSVRVGCGTGSPSDAGLTIKDGGSRSDSGVVPAQDGGVADVRDAGDTRDSTADTTARDGSSSTGGSMATGGTRATGGTTSTGGVTAKGGATSAGGALTGGTMGTGGVSSMGGVGSPSPATSGGSAALGGGTGKDGGSGVGDRSGADGSIVTKADNSSGCACAIGSQPRNQSHSLFFLIGFACLTAFARFRPKGG